MKSHAFTFFVASLLVVPLWLSSAVAAPAEIAKPAKSQNMPVVTGAWARATVPGQPVGAAYMTITSPANTKLLSAETDVARVVEVHDMHQHDGVMKMRAHGVLELTANQPFKLEPGGSHFMLLGLKQPLKAGEAVQLKLTFGQSEQAMNKQTVLVNVPVQPIGR